MTMIEATELIRKFMMIVSSSSVKKVWKYLPFCSLKLREQALLKLQFCMTKILIEKTKTTRKQISRK